MRLASKVAISLVVLLVLILVGLAVALPRIASSEAVRARLEAMGRDATGQSVEWDELAFGLLPPRLIVTKPKVVPLDGSIGSSLEADSISLRLALLPLLVRTVLVDSLVVEGAQIRMRRTEKGLELPLVRTEEARPAGERSAEGETRKETGEEREAIALAVGSLRLSNAVLLLEDRTVEPAITWELREIEASAVGSSLDGPIDVQVSAEIATGGTVRVEGNAWLDGRIDLAAELDRLVLEPLGGYLDSGERLAGQLSGRVEVRGSAGSPEALQANLALTEGDLQVADLGLRGRLTAQATLEGGLDGAAGPFEVNGTEAAVTYGEVFDKALGRSAVLSGRLVPGEEKSLAIEELDLKLHNLVARGRAETGPKLQLELDASPFDVTGWSDLVPALASLAPQGKLSLEKLTASVDPLEVRGRVILDKLRLSPPDRAPLELSGALEGVGDSIRSAGLEAVIGGERVALDVELSDLAGAPRYRIAARTEKAESNALLTALAGLSETLYGPLTGTTELAGPIGGDRSPLEAVVGQMRVDIGRGRLRGVSILRGSVERFGEMGEAALLVGALRGGKTLQRFYGDEFESISGTFRVQNGRGSTDDLQMVYRHYRVDLQGSVGLLDESLDLSGTLTIDEEVDAAIEGSAEQEPARSTVIPLAHVGGTIRSPRVEISREEAARLAARYAAPEKRRELEEKIDERLGEGAGREILGTLEQILGGGRKKEK